MKTGRRVAKESPVDVVERDGDEDEGEGEESSDEADYEQADGDYVDDEEAMGDDESYADDGAEEEVSWTEHAVACHAEGSDESEADDADATPDDEDDSEGADTGSHADGELDPVREPFAASALLDLHNGGHSSSSSATSYSPTPTILATSSSSEDKIPVIAAAPALDAVTESSATNLAAEALSSVPSASPLQPALEPPPNPSPMVQVTPSAYYSYPPPARPVDVGGEVEVGEYSFSTSFSPPPPPHQPNVLLTDYLPLILQFQLITARLRPSRLQRRCRHPSTSPIWLSASQTWPRLRLRLRLNLKLSQNGTGLPLSPLPLMPRIRIRTRTRTTIRCPIWIWSECLCCVLCDSAIP